MARGKIVNVSEVANTLTGATLEAGTLAIVDNGEGNWSVVLHDGETNGTTIGSTNGVFISNGNPVKLAASYSDYQNNKYIQIRPGENDSHIHIDSGDNSAYDVILGDDSRYISVDHQGFIRVNDGGNEWQFKGGKLKFPSQAPVESVGAEGDEAGMIAVDSNFLYYCIQDFGQPWTQIPIANAVDTSNNGSYAFMADILDITNITQPLRLTHVYANGSWTPYQFVVTYDIFDAQNNTYRFYFGQGVTGSSQASELQYLDVAQNIWKRVAWSNDTW